MIQQTTCPIFFCSLKNVPGLPVHSPQHLSLKTKKRKKIKKEKKKRKKKKKAFTDMLKTNFRKEENELDQISLLNRPS